MNSGWTDTRRTIGRTDMDMEIVIGIIKMIFGLVIGIPLICVCVIVGIIACLLFIMMCGVILAQVFGGGGDEM